MGSGARIVQVLTEAMANELAARILRERTAYYTEVRMLLDSHGQKRWCVWVTNWITRNSIAVFSAQDWEVSLHELV